MACFQDAKPGLLNATFKAGLMYRHSGSVRQGDAGRRGKRNHPKHLGVAHFVFGT